MTQTQVTQEQFLQAYKQAVENFVALYKQSDNPKHPTSLFYTRNFDYDRMDEMGAEYQEIVQSLHRLESGYRDYFQGIDAINNQAEKELKTWWNEHAYDYSLPDAPEIDHTEQKKLKNWTNPFTQREYKQVLQVGQFIVQRDIFSGEHYYDLLEANQARSACRGYELTCNGDREEKKAYQAIVIRLASELSKLTDWSQFDTLTPKQKRALGKRVAEVKRDVLGTK